VTAPLSEDRLAEYAALEAAATKGHWALSEFGEVFTADGDTIADVWEPTHASRNGEFIAQARVIVPELLAEVARLRAAVPAARASGYRAAADQAAEAVAVHGADADAVLLCLRQGAALREAIAGTGGVQ
jgi:hypothetical protein